MAFVHRKIDVTITLGSGKTTKLTGLRVKASIIVAGGNYLGAAEARIYGMYLDDMNVLSHISTDLTQAANNKILIEAGDDKDGMQFAYQGNINQCFADLNGQPEVFLFVMAIVGDFHLLKRVEPVSYPGTVDAADIMRDLAGKMGYGFRNNGVSVKLSTPYLPRTRIEQVRAVATAANCNFQIVDDKTLVIWPKGGNTGGNVFKLTPKTGLVGYPAYSPPGIAVTSLFNPSFQLGGKVEVESVILPACGTYTISGLTHSIESETPGGAWFTHLLCQAPDNYSQH